MVDAYTQPIRIKPVIENKLRPLYQKFLVDPVVKRIINQCTPNQITLVSCMLGIGVIPTLLMQQHIVATLLLLLSGYCDTLDGSLARLKLQSSNVGTVLDIMSDRLVEFAVIFALFALNPVSNSWGAVMMLGSILMCVTSFLVVGIFTPNNSHKGFHYSPGLMERAEAFIFFIAMIWFPRYFNILSSVFCILVLWTAYVRIQEFMQQFKAMSSNEQPELVGKFSDENISTGI